MLSQVNHEKSFKTSGPDLGPQFSLEASKIQLQMNVAAFDLNLHSLFRV